MCSHRETDMMLTPEQIDKMLVADIRTELKKRGAGQSGSKSALISRLKEIVKKENETEKPTDEPVQSLETKTAVVDSHVSEEKEKEAKITTVTSQGTEEDGEIKPKHQRIIYNIPQKNSATMKADEEEKKRRRAERFGIVDTTEREAKKMKARSERFSVKYTESDESSKMEQRAKRFAQGDSKGGGSVDAEQRDIIDLSHIVTSATVTEEEKKRRRAERFGVTDK